VPSALAAGVGLVPEDRRLQGLVTNRSVAENATLTVTDQLGPYGIVLPSRTRAFAQRMIRELDIKTPGPATPVSALSGGNQQKVVIARALAADPHVLVTIRPTNGVDIKSKEFLLRRIRQVADDGRAALLISDELDDLRICDRVIAMFHGRVIAEFRQGWRDDQLVAAMEGVPAIHPAATALAGPDAGPHAGAVSGSASGPGAGPEVGPEAEPVSGFTAGPGAGPEVGPEAEPVSGVTGGPGAGSGARESGAGTAVVGGAGAGAQAVAGGGTGGGAAAEGTHITDAPGR
jgi:simple sugar transport system ATP-binding protein